MTDMLACPACARAIRPPVVSPIHCACGRTYDLREAVAAQPAPQKESCPYAGPIVRTIPAGWLDCSCGSIMLHHCAADQSVVTLREMPARIAAELQRPGQSYYVPDYLGLSCQRCPKKAGCK